MGLPAQAGKEAPVDPVNLDEYEALARERLPQMVWDYYSAGAEDMRTLAANRDSWSDFELHYRVMVDVSRRDASTRVVGAEAAFPVLIAPTAFQRMAHPDGEVATARAAGTAGVPMVLSTISTSSIEEVCEAASGPIWFQLYVYRDREATRALVARAEAAGCSALVLTVDAAIWGRREPDIRNRFHLPEGLSVKNLSGAGMEDLPPEAGSSGLQRYVENYFDPSLTWDDLEWLVGITRLPVLVKGIVRADDAVEACRRGARAVVVSNHGGRQLDGSPAPARVLEEIVQAVGERGEVLVDGGVRRGTDVVKAIALGARAVLIGRPVLWGLAVDGERGVRGVLERLREEFDVAMGLCGAANLAALTRDLLRRTP